jgi:dihydrofolate reductase
MRDLVVTENITLDGVVDASEGWFAPSDADADGTADELAVQREHMADADAVLLGRVNYQNRTTKYVVSSSLEAPTWQNTVILRGPPADEAAALKQRPGKAIVATGSVRLVRELMWAGLVDEYRLFVHPVVLGRGRRLFEEATAMPALRLAQALPFRSGVVLMRYRTRAGS